MHNSVVWKVTVPAVCWWDNVSSSHGEVLVKCQYGQFDDHDRTKPSGILGAVGKVEGDRLPRTSHISVVCVATRDYQYYCWKLIYIRLLVTLFKGNKNTQTGTVLVASVLPSVATNVEPENGSGTVGDVRSESNKPTTPVQILDARISNCGWLRY